MIINAVKCTNCGDIIYSRARHDFHGCSCGKTMVDGGFDYQRVLWEDPFVPEEVEIEIKATKDELYRDWARGNNKFGLVTFQNIP
jgi:hypothetical protein